MSSAASLSILLLQIRDHLAAERQELECFAAALSVPPGTIDTHNVVRYPKLDWSRVENCDLLIIGGAGEHSVTQEHEFSPYLAEVSMCWIQDGRPFFGSCYGHHVLGKIFGSDVVRDPACGEIGTFEVELTSEGRSDPVFEDLPDSFSAQLGHHDRVVGLPDGLVELARSERCANQALRVAGKPAYSTQFHAEMNADHMYERLLMYRDGYLDPKTSERVLRGLRSSPVTGGILARFVETYL